MTQTLYMMQRPSIPVGKTQDESVPKYRNTIVRVVAGAAMVLSASSPIAAKTWNASSFGSALVSSRGPQIKSTLRQKQIVSDAEETAAAATPADDAVDVLDYIANNSKLPTSEIARCLSVSRQAVYSWQKGGAISQDNLEKLRSIRDAVAALAEAEFKPNRNLLRRKIGGKSILDIVAAGGDVREASNRLLTSLLRDREQLAASKARVQDRKKSGDTLKAERIRDALGQPTRNS
ncbi:hypothetical protein [Ruegeria sp. HKCCD7559]|uniref:hypothetical protein n=1 Tax=Ruegeria sp. HKCCD7559 TaxID=2683005 RepID=UPI001491977C|nr:hypothetical protein [Ruegeria sp. HKCCD7559]NOC47001.1 hypothetical protein [Ruegeria sp. HKCCD7559]